MDELREHLIECEVLDYLKHKKKYGVKGCYVNIESGVLDQHRGQNVAKRKSGEMDNSVRFNDVDKRARIDSGPRSKTNADRKLAIAKARAKNVSNSVNNFAPVTSGAPVTGVPVTGGSFNQSSVVNGPSITPNPIPGNPAQAQNSSQDRTQSPTTLVPLSLDTPNNSNAGVLDMLGMKYEIVQTNPLIIKPISTATGPAKNTCVSSIVQPSTTGARVFNSIQANSKNIIEEAKRQKANKNNPKPLLPKGEHNTCSVCLVKCGESGQLNHHKLIHDNICPWCERQDDGPDISEKYEGIPFSAQGLSGNPPPEGGSDVTHDAVLTEKKFLLAEHLQRVHNVCHHCYAKQNDKDSLYQHLSRHYLKCLGCYKTFQRTQDYNVHIGNFVYQNKECSQCLRLFQNAEACEEHFRNSHKASFSCRLCPKTFPSPYLRKKHMRYMHPHGKASLQCDICKKSMYTKLGMKQHMKSHTQDPEERREMNRKLNAKYTCLVCNQKFRWQRALSDHMQSKHLKVFYFCMFCKIPNLDYWSKVSRNCYPV